MKAIVARAFGGPEVLTLEERPVPSPDSEQVLVRVRAAGVNPADTYIRAGIYPIKPDLPYTPGGDFAGVVDAVGSAITTFAVGDRVYSDGHSLVAGAYAEWVVYPAAHLYHLPDRVSFAQGAALGVPYATAWRALLQRAHAQPGEVVLVHGGSGGVGTAAIQIARAHGMQVIATAGTPEGLDLVRREGAHAAIDHREPGYADAIQRFTTGRGVDVVLEMLANVNLDRDLDLIAKGGRIVVIGNRGRIEIDPRKAMGKDAAILGMVLFNTPPDQMRQIHAGLRTGLESGTLRPVIGREMPLAEAAGAHAAVMAPGARGKIVLVP